MDIGVSQAVRDSSKISMTKNLFKGRVETTLTAEKASFKRNRTDVWKNYGCFSPQACDFSTEKANLPEMSILYVNQAYQSYKDNKKVYYYDYLIEVQVTPCLNPPEDLRNCECQPNEAKIYCPKYDTVSGEFLGLFQTLNYLTICGDSGECFLDYGYSKDNSKILYSL